MFLEATTVDLVTGTVLNIAKRGVEFMARFALLLVTVPFLLSLVGAGVFDGKVGVWVPITTIALGSMAYLAMASMARAIAPKKSGAKSALWAASGVILLVVLLAVQLGGIIYGGRNTWTVKDADSCAPVQQEELDLSTCDEVSPWQAGLLVAWHVADAAPLAKATELTNWKVPAVYESSWVGILLVYAKALLIAPSIALVRGIWKAAVSEEEPPKGTGTPEPGPAPAA